MKVMKHFYENVTFFLLVFSKNTSSVLVLLGPGSLSSMCQMSPAPSHLVPFSSISRIS